MEYLTIEKFAFEEYIINKSRFIGYAKPVTTQEEAVEFINSVREKHRDATHNVYAYALRQPEYSRYSDDGEPQGTAGVPVLDVIKKSGLTDCCVVVTRYFGGILLGAGGLVRAYSHSAKLALDAAKTVKMGLCFDFSCTCDYGLYSKLQTLLNDFGATVENTDFGENIKVYFTLPEEKAAPFQKQLTELSFGKIKPEKTGEKFGITEKMSLL